MQIIGSGIDMVTLSRFKRLQKVGKLDGWARGFSGEELTQAGPSDGAKYIQHLAGNFAVKEATYKACGGTPTGEIDWTEIQVIRALTGQPILRITGEMLQYCTQLGITGWTVSIAYTSMYALGSAIAYGE